MTQMAYYQAFVQYEILDLSGFRMHNVFACFIINRIKKPK